MGMTRRRLRRMRRAGAGALRALVAVCVLAGVFGVGLAVGAGTQAGRELRAEGARYGAAMGRDVRGRLQKLLDLLVEQICEERKK